MNNPGLPANEEKRIVELASYDLQNNDTEEDFDQLSALLAQFFKCPIALVTVMDSTRQWFKGKSGTTETGNSRELSFCAYTLLQDEVMVVEDASIDQRFFNNPFVTGDYNIRFYAGTPIVSEDGFILGSICIYDTKKRKLPLKKRKAMLLFSKQVSRLLALRKKNILLRQQAEEIINVRSEIFTRYIQSQEAGKKEIAYNLHEDFAQGIAASLMMLKLTKVPDQKNAELVSEAIKQLKEVIVDIRNLSYSITPHLLDWMVSDEILKDFIEKIASSFPFSISVESSGNPKECSNELTICAIRLIEQWLQVLLIKKQLSHVHVVIKYDDQLILTFDDDAAAEALASRKKEVFESILYDQARAQGGSVELSHADSGKNRLKILLPFNP